MLYGRQHEHCSARRALRALTGLPGSAWPTSLSWHCMRRGFRAYGVWVTLGQARVACPMGPLSCTWAPLQDGGCRFKGYSAL